MSHPERLTSQLRTYVDASRAGGLLGRLKGLVHDMKPTDESAPTEEVLPTWDVALPPPPGEPAEGVVPVAEPMPSAEEVPPESAPQSSESALPAQTEPSAEEAPPAECLGEPVPEIPSPLLA